MNAEISSSVPIREKLANELLQGFGYRPAWLIRNFRPGKKLQAVRTKC
jgi:hypothetical protein